MVAVATSFNAPIKLVYPQPRYALNTSRPFAMLGLGDIVIPGLVVSLVLRYDMSNHAGKPLFFVRYHHDLKTLFGMHSSAMTGYAVGLISTVVVMNVFKAAQPALLYIVPSVLTFILGHAAICGEFNQVKQCV